MCCDGCLGSDVFSLAPPQLALERADALLDMVAAGASGSYDAVRSDLSDAYREAGLSDVANFIRAA